MSVVCWWMFGCVDPKPVEPFEDSAEQDSGADAGETGDSGETGRDWEIGGGQGRDSEDGDTGDDVRAPEIEPRSDAPYVKVAVYLNYYCGLHADGVLDCNQGQLRTEIPDVLFQDFVISGAVGCGLDLDGSAHCWGEEFDEPDVAEPPEGTFVALSIGTLGMECDEVCGLAEDGSVTCWGTCVNWEVEPYYVDLIEGAPGPYVALVDGIPSCGITAEGVVECWGEFEFFDVTSDPEWPSLPVESLSCHGGACCAILMDDSLRCWNTGSVDHLESPPAGTWSEVSVGQSSIACALAQDGTLACWGSSNQEAVTSAPTGAFLAMDAGPYGACASDASGSLGCWGSYF